MLGPCRRVPRHEEIATRGAEQEFLSPHGLRPVFGGYELFQTDSHWHDQLWFHEYFHGDTGAGLGASYQTGWTGLVAACLLQRPDPVE